MKAILFNEKSKTARYIFQKLLNGMDSPFRKKINDPQKLIIASGIQPGQTALEVGCGSGYFTPLLSDFLGETGYLHSIDLHPMAVETTRRKMHELGKKNVHVEKVDAHATHFPNNSFDMVVLYGVVPAPVISESTLAKEMFRLLKPGGILAVWTIAPFWSPKALLKSAPFKLIEKKYAVYNLQKPSREQGV